jgi:hypothetical protein
VRRRDAVEGRFLTRGDGEWAALLPFGNGRLVNSLPKFAGALLASAGLLDEAEVARLGRISDGVERHPTIDAATAGRILERTGAR